MQEGRRGSRWGLAAWILATAMTALAGGRPVAGQEPKLEPETHERIAALSEKGDALAEQGHYREAVATYVQALQLLPEPMEQWGACTRLLAAIGDANFRWGQYEYSARALSDAMRCPGGLGNPFIHLRLGQSRFELGEMERAADELARAYMGGGKEIFDDEAPKYFEFLKTVLKPPADGKW